MITTTRLDNLEAVDHVVPPGWVRDYVHAVACARFPLSFHLLSGLFALSTIVGRRARLRRAGYRLYPPLWILLLGFSGVGKGKSMWVAERVVRTATAELPFLVHSPDTFTRRGFIRACQEQAALGVESLEGAIFLDEISSVLAKRTGTENIVQFFIKASDMGTVEDMSGQLGLQQIRDFTIGFAASTTLELLRENVSASVFSGGLMHRFITAFEIAKPNTPEQEPDPTLLNELAERAVRIRANAPPEMQLDADADRLLRGLARRSEVTNYPTTRLAGFWNRIDGLVAKVAMTLTLSRGSALITGDDVQRASHLLLIHLYPPLVELVRELAHGPGKQALFQAADDLYCAGKRGMALADFQKLLPGMTGAQMRGQMQFVRHLGLAYEGKGPDEQPWVWRFPDWAG